MPAPTMFKCTNVSTNPLFLQGLPASVLGKDPKAAPVLPAGASFVADEETLMACAKALLQFVKRGRLRVNELDPKVAAKAFKAAADRNAKARAAAKAAAKRGDADG